MKSWMLRCRWLGTSRHMTSKHSYYLYIEHLSTVGDLLSICIMMVLLQVAWHVKAHRGRGHRRAAALWPLLVGASRRLFQYQYTYCKHGKCMSAFSAVHYCA